MFTDDTLFEVDFGVEIALYLFYEEQNQLWGIVLAIALWGHTFTLMRKLDINMLTGSNEISCKRKRHHQTPKEFKNLWWGCNLHLFGII